MKQANKSHAIGDVIVIVLLIIALLCAYKFYHDKNLGNFSVSEKTKGTSTFTKDTTEKYYNKNSYKITSSNYNDAMFVETVKVKPNTPYKVTCMVKTKDVQSENNLLGSGAQISIADTTERSVAISGTSDWQQIEMIFNSKNREEINIGFRLGGYIDNCKGEAWFANFKLEEGEQTSSNSNWKFACFIFDSIDATSNGKEIKYSLSQENIQDMKNTINRFETSAKEMSKNKMTAECDVYKINEPIKNISYDKEYGYYVSPEDVESQIKSVISSNDYDHIFIIFKLGDNEVKDWIGLGSMDYYGIGFSNIRLPNKESSYIYKYNPAINTFPEEVLLHEFLHSLERTLNEYGYNIPALHDYEKYGYKVELKDGLKKWYADYMNCNITDGDKKIGLDPIVYTLKPAKESNFSNSTVVNDALHEPENFKEELQLIYKRLRLFATTVTSNF